MFRADRVATHGSRISIPTDSIPVLPLGVGLVACQSRGRIPTVDLVRRDVDRDFRDRIDVVRVDAEFARSAREEKAADGRNINLEPHLLVVRLCRGIRADDVVPHRLERGRKVRRERKRTAGVLETGDVSLLSYRLFIRYLLWFPISSAYLFAPSGASRPRGGIISFHPLCVAPGCALHILRFGFPCLSV